MRLGALVLTALFVVPLVVAQSEAEATDADRCPDLRFMQGVGHVCPWGPGYLEVYAPDGRSLGFTHGPDPLCEGCVEPQAGVQGSTSVHCVDGTTSEYFIRVIYARASDDTDRYASMVGTIRTLVQNANAMVDDAAIATGDRISLRVKCTGGVIAVDNVVLPTRRSSATYATVIDDLENAGYTSIRQKHWVYYDDAGACACLGIAHRYADESNSVNNLNNGASGTQPMFAISFDSPSVRTLLHELGHNLGAVQDGAPRSTLAGHCTDGLDTMCYNDGGPRGNQYSSGFCGVEVFDCNKDTYCHANPPAGSYLATRWQVCHRQNRFIQYADNVAPTMTSLSCTPNPSYVDEVVTCTFAATDPNVGVYYRIDWGDGSTSRVPATGTVTPGATQTATHAYTASAERTIRVNATDTGTPPLTSADRTFAQSVGPSNVAPLVVGLGCTPSAPAEGDTVTCSWSADDVHNVHYQITWGDGTPSARVPASGVVPPGATQSATHVYTRGGSFPVAVTATDDGRPAKTGPTATLALPVTEVNTPPGMVSLSCPGGPLRPGDVFSCSFRADDDTSGVRYEINWGDGSADLVPPSGYVAPGTTQTASHSYLAKGDYTITVRATDSFSPPATSGTLFATKTVLEDVSPPTVLITDPRTDRVYVGCGASFDKIPSRALYVNRGCVRAIVTDPSGVARVDVLRQGVVIATDVSAPYELEFDVPSGSTGVAYDLKATDIFGYTRTERFVVDAIGGRG